MQKIALQKNPVTAAGVGLDFSLCELSKNDYTYPVEGWHWFASAEDAQAFFNVPSATEPPFAALVAT